jgi:hypothetical protein
MGPDVEGLHEHESVGGGGDNDVHPKQIEMFPPGAADGLSR